MTVRSRRDFLADVGRGMLAASVGAGMAIDLGLMPAAHAADADKPDKLTFGSLEPLVGLMQDTPANKLLPKLIEQHDKGADAKTLVAAAALANARAFGGEDYTGFHTLMALAPAYQMSREVPKERQLLPILKVLYRNTTRIQEKGGPKAEVLKPVKAAPWKEGLDTTKVLLDAMCSTDKDRMETAERTFATVAQHGKPEDAFNQLLPLVSHCLEVHRTVLPYRAWVLLDIVGKEHAHTMLRQSLRYCVVNHRDAYSKHFEGIRALLPKLLDQHKLPGKKRGEKKAEDTWVDALSQTIFKAKPEEAAEAVAAALAEGFSYDAAGEAISLASNQLVLRDAGRPEKQTSPNKPKGSVHGDSIGVHACDSANAWRQMANVANPLNAVSCLILSGWQVAHDRGDRGGEFLEWKPRPWDEHLKALKGKDARGLLEEAEDAIKTNDQARACAAVHRYGGLEGAEARPVFDLLLKYGISEDGALHAEKYYQTVCDEFALTRPAFRWRQLVALARVTASECNQPAPGYAEACRLLKV